VKCTWSRRSDTRITQSFWASRNGDHTWHASQGTSHNPSMAVYASFSGPHISARYSLSTVAQIAADTTLAALFLHDGCLALGGACYSPGLRMLKAERNTGETFPIMQATNVYSTGLPPPHLLSRNLVFNYPGPTHAQGRLGHSNTFRTRTGHKHVHTSYKQDYTQSKE
jgi:hypothetical protein